MRRRRRHLMIALLMTAVLAAAAGRLALTGDSSVPEVPAADLGSAAEATPVYVLAPSQWTVFRIPGAAERVQVLSHAGLLVGATGHAPDSMDYRIEFQLASLSGEVLDSGTWTYRVASRKSSGSAGGERALPVFYEDATIVPSSPRRSQIDLVGGEVSLLSLRAVELTPPVSDVAVRVAIRQEVPERKLAYLWARKSDGQRARLTASRVHGAFGLTDEERRNLLLTRWSPIGPQGVEDRDYQARILFERDDVDGVPPALDPRFDVRCLRVHSGLRGVLGIPSKGQVTLRFLAPDESGRGEPPVTAQPVIIRYFGTSLRERETCAHRPDEGTAFEREFGPGMLVIDSETQWIVEGTLADSESGEPAELACHPDIVRAWRCGHATEGESGVVRFSLGEGASGHLLKLALRSRAESPVRATIAWEDENDQLIESVDVAVGPVRSVRDCLVEEGEWLPVSEPAEFVLTIPDHARRLRVEAEGEIIVVAHTRPAELRHRVRVPGDYVRAIDDPLRPPLWFPLTPPDAGERIKGFHSVVLRLQDRPPEDDGEVLAGNYEWEDFDPVSGGMGTYLLSERDTKSPERIEAAPSIFSEVPSDGSPFRFPVFAAHGIEQPTRKLVFARTSPGASPVMLRLIRGGHTVLDEPIFGRAGEFVIPSAVDEEATAGSSPPWRIECSEPGIRCFMNHGPPERAAWIRRFVHRLGPDRPLCFEIDKQAAGQELLTAGFQAVAESRGPTTILVDIVPMSEGAGPAPGMAARFTPLRREFVLDEGAAEREMFVLSGGPALQAGEQRFFIPLGDDLSPGRYQVTFRVTGGGGGGLSLSRVVGGAYSWARFTREDGR